MLKTGKRLKLFKLHRHIDVLSKRLKEIMREVEERQVVPKTTSKQGNSEDNTEKLAINFTKDLLTYNPLD